MIIIGIHDGHNASVCLLKDGVIKWVIQEERIVREKNFDGFPHNALLLALEKEGLTAKEVDLVALSGRRQSKPMDRSQRLEAFKNLGSGASKVKSKLKKIKLISDAYTLLNNQARIQPLIDIGFVQSQIEYVEHHTAHAAAAYFTVDDANQYLVLTNDGSGDRLCASISIGCDGALERVGQVDEHHSIGLIYAIFTFLTGMVPLEHEFKIMGMAPYADLKSCQRVADEFHQMFELLDEGTSWRFTKGESVYQSLQYFKDFMYLKRFDHLMGGLQLFTEQFLTRWVQACIKKTGISRVRVSGGTFMNVKANKCIMELDEVESLFVFPSCGDESNAIGAAYYCFSKRQQPCDSNCASDSVGNTSELTDVYFGIEFDNEEIKSAISQASCLKDYNIKFYKNIEYQIALCLSQNHVVARFFGREEFGARSLGNRAILGNPSSRDVVKEINEMIKNRDFWMPFASSVLDEDFDRYVKSNEKNSPYYMVMTYDTQPAAEEIIAGIHPYDKTIRPQLVTAEHNPDYWNMLKQFKALTGIGGVLNTSLNLHGLPLVHNPEDAFEVLEKSALKYLAIGNYLISKT